jgi:flagellar motor switch protein FliN/FliY
MDTTADNAMEQQKKNDTVSGTARQGESAQQSKNKRELDFLFDVPLKISVEVGRALLVVKDLLQMQEGYVIELDKAAGEPLDLYVNSRLIARGEAVLVNDKFGIRLTEVVSPSERLEKLG